MVRHRERLLSRWRTATQRRAQAAEITTHRSWHTLRHGFGVMARPAPDVVPERPHLRKRYVRHELESSVLYQVVQAWLETFLAMASEAYLRPLPRHVVEEFEKYLRCGILAWGFARAYCRSCGASMLVAFSCKASFAACARRAERGVRARPQQTSWTESCPAFACDNGC